MQHAHTFARLAAALDDVRTGRAGPAALVAAVRAQTGLLADLPPRFGAALEQVATRLESASLFREESCSFCQRDLVDALAEWIDRARARVGADAQPSAAPCIQPRGSNP